jgi:hypothetical protein
MWAKGDSFLNRSATLIARVFHWSFKVQQGGSTRKKSKDISDFRIQI